MTISQMVNCHGSRLATPDGMPPTWTLLQLAGVLAATLVFFRCAPRADRVTFVAALPFLVVGALGFDWFFELSAWAVRGARGPMPGPGGVVAYGALFGFVLAYVGMTMLRRRDPSVALDAVIAPLLTIVAFGRVGCFFAGCEEGCATHVPWSVPGHDPTHRVHPVALYEVVAALIALAVSRSVRRERFAAGAITYGALRIVVELFRAHEGLVSAGQWTSVFVIGGALAWLTRGRPIERRFTVDAAPRPH